MDVIEDNSDITMKLFLFPPECDEMIVSPSEGIAEETVFTIDLPNCYNSHAPNELLIYRFNFKYYEDSQSNEQLSYDFMQVDDSQKSTTLIGYGDAYVEVIV